MNQIVKALDLDGLRNYYEFCKTNKKLLKFVQKFGHIDFDNIPEGFSIPLYKRFVVDERKRRELRAVAEGKQPHEINLDEPKITPAMFFKPVNQVKDEAPVEPEAEEEVGDESEDSEVAE